MIYTPCLTSTVHTAFNHLLSFAKIHIFRQTIRLPCTLYLHCLLQLVLPLTPNLSYFPLRKLWRQEVWVWQERARQDLDDISLVYVGSQCRIPVHQELVQQSNKRWHKGKDRSEDTGWRWLWAMVGAHCRSPTRKLDCYWCISIGVDFKLAVVVSEWLRVMPGPGCALRSHGEAQQKHRQYRKNAIDTPRC